MPENAASVTQTTTRIGRNRNPGLAPARGRIVASELIALTHATRRFMTSSWKREERVKPGGYDSVVANGLQICYLPTIQLPGVSRLHERLPSYPRKDRVQQSLALEEVHR
jgi:hypothetical protein